MARTVEIAILRTVLNTRVVTHLADIYLAALGPHHSTLCLQLRGTLIDIVIVTQAPEQINPIDKHNFIARLKLKSYQKVYFSHIHYCNPIPLMGTAELPLNTIDSVLAVTGIAHPEPMLKYISTHCDVTPMRFSDHHRYTVSDIKRIRKAFEQLKGNRRLILTTEKDAVRFRELAGNEAMAGLPIYYLPIEVRITQTAEDSFDHAIESIVHENDSFLDRMHKTKFTF